MATNERERGGERRGGMLIDAEMRAFVNASIARSIFGIKQTAVVHHERAARAKPSKRRAPSFATSMENDGFFSPWNNGDMKIERKRGGAEEKDASIQFRWMAAVSRPKRANRRQRDRPRFTDDRWSVYYGIRGSKTKGN